MLKRFFIFSIILIPWFFSSFLPINYNYYNTLNLPFFAPPKFFFSFSWGVIYIFITFSIYGIIKSIPFKKIPLSYKITLLINYLFNQSYILVGFVVKNNFLGFISCLATFISCLFLIVETKTLNEKSTRFLVPYAFLSLFATILAFFIYIMNLF